MADEDAERDARMARMARMRKAKQGRKASREYAAASSAKPAMSLADLSAFLKPKTTTPERNIVRAQRNVVRAPRNIVRADESATETATRPGEAGETAASC